MDFASVAWAAEAVAVSSGAVAGGGGGITAMSPEHWAMGAGAAILTALAPALFKRLKAGAAALPGRLVDAARARWQSKLTRREVDADLDRLAHKVAWAVAEYAEAKLPDSGAGPERMAMLRTMACSLPFGIGWAARMFWPEIQEALEAALAAADAQAKEIAGHGKPAVQPAPPAQPAPTAGGGQSG